MPIVLESIREEIRHELPHEVIRGNYRGSEIGDCPRYQAYRQLGFKREKIGPELKAIFDLGHETEARTINYLKRAGILVTNQQHLGFQSYEVVLDGETFIFNITTSLDLIMHFNKKRYIVDVKSTNPFSVRYLSRNYVREKYPYYYDQLQVYMNLFKDVTEPEGALLFAERAFGKLIEVWFKRDEDYFNNVILRRLAKIERAVSAKKLPARPKGYKVGGKECEGCTMRIHCWGKKMKAREW